MSIFIANLAFAGQPDAINASKMAILAGSLASGILGYLWLTTCPRPESTPRPS
jgi:NhaA family Na+:H+ antiporter